MLCNIKDDSNVYEVFIRGIKRSLRIVCDLMIQQ